MGSRKDHRPPHDASSIEVDHPGKNSLDLQPGSRKKKKNPRRILLDIFSKSKGWKFGIKLSPRPMKEGGMTRYILRSIFFIASGGPSGKKRIHQWQATFIFFIQQYSDFFHAEARKTYVPHFARTGWRYSKAYL